MDEPDRWTHAARRLRATPGIVTASIWAAAAAADPAAVRMHLATDPALANAEGGPHRWPPLMYLAYSRIGRAEVRGDGFTAVEPPPAGTEPVGDEPAVVCARLLLDAGADPNAGYLWRGMPTPFTVLTGVFGGGEQGLARQPAHPDAPALGRLLLERGADPNDGQTLYNRMFTPDNQHLRLLLEFGLGSGDGGPWRRLLGEALDSPAELLAQQLAWAIWHRFGDRVRLLVWHRIDVHRPLPSWPCPGVAGLLPAEAARRAGSADIARILTRAGAEPIDPTGEQRAMAELLAGRALGTADADAVAALRAAEPDLVHRADSPRAVRAVLTAGFAVDARRNGATALHWAAWRGRRELVRALLRAGADPAVTDAGHGATPLGWAEHARQTTTMAMLQDTEHS